MMKICVGRLQAAESLPFLRSERRKGPSLSLEPAAAFHLDLIFAASFLISGIFAFNEYVSHYQVFQIFVLFTCLHEEIQIETSAFIKTQSGEEPLPHAGVLCLPQAPPVLAAVGSSGTRSPSPGVTCPPSPLCTQMASAPLPPPLQFPPGRLPLPLRPARPSGTGSPDIHGQYTGHMLKAQRR